MKEQTGKTNTFLVISDCFKPMRPYGKVLAIFTTYLASIMLHGLNFQLAAVLLSLGFYTYTEFSLRKKLADIFDASVAASREKDRSYKYPEGRFPVMCVNLVFGLLGIFNLAYLGVMFNQDNTMVRTIIKWLRSSVKQDLFVL